MPTSHQPDGSGFQFLDYIIATYPRGNQLDVAQTIVDLRKAAEVAQDLSDRITVASTRVAWSNPDLSEIRAEAALMPRRLAQMGDALALYLTMLAVRPGLQTSRPQPSDQSIADTPQQQTQSAASVPEAPEAAGGAHEQL